VNKKTNIPRRFLMEEKFSDFKKFLESNKIDSGVVELLKSAYSIGFKEGQEKLQKESYEEWNQK